MKTKIRLIALVFVLLSFSLLTVNVAGETNGNDEDLDAYFAGILGESASDTDTEEDEEKVYTPSEAIENAKEKGQIVSVSNDKFSIIIDKATGYLYLTNLKDNKIWSSCPYDYLSDEVASGITRTNLRSLFVVNYITSDSISVINSYAGSVLNDGVKYTVKNNTITAVYTFADEGFVIPFKFKLNKTGMDVSVVFKNIKDTAEKRIHSIEVLPYFGAAGPNETGYMVIPDGSGAIINFNNGKSDFSPYEKDFYGGNKCQLINFSPTEEEAIRLPFYAVCSGEDAFVATVTKGAELASLYASLPGKISNYNVIYTKVVYRAYDTVDLKDSIGKQLFAKYSAIDHVNLKEYTVSYSLLSKEKANIVGISDTARKKLFSGDLEKNSDGQLKLYLDLFGAVQKEKAFLGFRFTGVQPLTTYDQAKTIISDFKKAGVNDLKLGYRYCSDLTYKGKISSEISPASALGGKSGFKSLLKFATNNGAEIFPYVNFVSFKNSGNSYAPSRDSIMGLQMSLVELYPYNINDGQRNKNMTPTYLVSASRYNKAERHLLNSLEKYNTGLLFDESANYIYSDYVRGGYQADRVTSSQAGIFKKIRKNSGSIMMSNPNSYAIKYADYLSDIPMHSSGYYIFDKDIPLVQLVLRGYVPYSCTSLNVKGINDDTVLKILETGSNIKFDMFYNKGNTIINTELGNALYGATYHSTKENALKLYKELKPVFKKISNAEVNTYNSEDNVVSLSYDNGVQIVLNYNDEPVEVDSTKVEAKSYRIVEK